MREEHGISSVELLIASAIALIILAGTLGSLNGSLKLNEQAALATDLEQNLRAGMNFLVKDFVTAGWGIPTGGIPIPSGTGAQPVHRPGPPGSDYHFASETLAAVNPGAGLGAAWNGQPTDIVNILCADSLIPLNEWPLTAISISGGASQITVDSKTQISGIDGAIREGDLIALSNANGSTLQYVTSVAGQTINFGSGDPLNLNQPNAPQGSISLLQNAGVFPPTTATRVWLITYYLDYTFDADKPRLIRRINDGTGHPIALVLEDLQLTYDLVDGDTNPTDIDSPVAPNSNNQIRKANILLSGRSGERTRDSHEFMRRSLRTQVSLRSLSFMDRYR